MVGGYAVPSTVCRSSHFFAALFPGALPSKWMEHLKRLVSNVEQKFYRGVSGVKHGQIVLKEPIIFYHA